MAEYVRWFNTLGMGDVDKVGGKNASLGEMNSNLAGARETVPNGFATTADAFRTFLAHDGLDHAQSVKPANVFGHQNSCKKRV